MLNKAKASKKQIVGVLLDLGNSETRVRVKYRPIKGIGVEHDAVESTFAISNHYANLEASKTIEPEYQNDSSTIMDINGVRVAHGLIVEREFDGMWLYPTGKGDKCTEAITEWTVRNVLLKTIHLLADAWGISPSEVDVAFNVFCLIPPEEHQYNKDGMINLIADIDEVVELVPDAEGVYHSVPHEIICNTIQTFPEGITAFVGISTTIANNKVSSNPEVAPFMKGLVLIIDIGAGTTDMAIMQDGMLRSDSRFTCYEAGNHIQSVFMRSAKGNPVIRTRLSGRPIKNMQAVMGSAMIIEGAGIEEDCRDALNVAKEDLAGTLANSIASYMQGLNVAQDIKGVLVVGGANAPAIRDGEVVSPSLDTWLIPRIKKFCPGASLMPIGNRDPRYLNLDGLEAMYLAQVAKEKA